ncbi:MAG: hypothetical protein ABW110_16495 [Steroidobacteraceae bacterium]
MKRKEHLEGARACRYDETVVILSTRLRMSLIELPRALEDYFACAEIEPTRRGRRFSISLNFYNGERLDRLQWWYHVSAVQEQMFDGTGLVVFRERAIERFRKHIERWLANTRQYLHGTEPIPRIAQRAASPAMPGPDLQEPPLDDVEQAMEPSAKVANA